MWIKMGDRTFQIFSQNIHYDGVDYQLWVQVAGKQNIMIKHGNKDDVRNAYDAINYTIENDKKLLEM